MSRTVEERSAGGVLLMRMGQEILVPLIHLRRGDVLGLPKGHIEPGESPDQTAVRETREETGLAGRVLAPLEEISYMFWSRSMGTRISKSVAFFLMEYRAGAPAPQEGEVDDIVLVPARRATAALTYPGERRVMQGALAWLDAAGYGAGEANTRSSPPA
ncbi:MAG: NUDIX hydrolase [Thermoleophilia bacterium]